MGHLFAIQVLLQLQTTGSLRGQLHEIIKRSPHAANYQDTWHFWRMISGALTAWWNQFELGVWDYFEDQAKSQRELEQWCEGTVADAEEAMQEQKGQPMHPYRPSTGDRFMFVTMLFMLHPRGPADRMVCDLCRIPEHAMWTKATFARLIGAIPHMSFPSVRTHAIYVRPGIDEAGVSREELGEEKYRYLRRLA